MISIFSLENYGLFNGAIAAGYIISKCILSLPYYKSHRLQTQRLAFARYSFLVTLALFFLMPMLLKLFPSASNSTFQLQPILKTASSAMFHAQHNMVEKLIFVPEKNPILNIKILLLLTLISGVILFLLKYIKNLHQLNKLAKNAYCQHHMHHVRILYSDVTVPFCWSFIKEHFIVIPHKFLEKREDLKLAIRHELQHIRQGDTRWLHMMSMIKALCFWNPFVKLWINWLDELQEFSCDEALVSRKKSSPIGYAQCLIHSASNTLNTETLPQGVLGIRGLSQSVLYRRVNMLINYKNTVKKSSFITAYVISFLAAGSMAYALSGSSYVKPLTTHEVSHLIEKANLDKSFHVAATPEVVNELNHIMTSNQARTTVHDALQRMETYKPMITASLKNQHMPHDLLVVPLVESGYQPLEENKNSMLAAGIWQIIPETGKHLGLNVHKGQDERMNTQLATKAALSYLNANYKQFNDWKLAVIAYEIGEQQTEALIKNIGTRDAWALARSSAAPSSLKAFLARLDAELIIMHYPSLVN